MAVITAMRDVLASGGAARSDPPPAMPGSRRPPPPPRELGGIGTRDTISQELARLPPDRRPRLIASAAAVLLLLVAITAGAAWYGPGAESAVPPTPMAALSAPIPVATPEPPAPPEVPVAPALEVTPVVALTESAPRSQAIRPRPPARSSVAPTSPAVTAHAEPEAPVLAEHVDSTDRTPALLRDASSAMLHGEIPRAHDLYREATLAAPRNSAAWRGLGLACERLRLVPEARRAYQRYLDLAPDARDATTVRTRLEALGS